MRAARTRTRTVRGWRRGAAVVATVTLGLIGTSLPAEATITTPSPGETVRGVVTITDTGATGGAAACGVTTAGSVGQLYSRVEVHRVDANGTSVEQVFTKTNTVAAAVADDPSTTDVDESAPAVPKGAWTTTWDTAGLPNGTYRILAFNRNASGTTNCNLLPESLNTDQLVTLENAVTVEATVPERVVSGEDLVVEVLAEDEGTGKPAPGRDVDVTVDGLDPVTVTTDGAGRATATISLPDLDAGTYGVVADAASTPGFVVGRSDDDGEVDVLHRSVKVEWTGDTQSRTTETAHLASRVTDATPGSDRFGDPVEGLPVTTAIGDEVRTSDTDADGRTAHDVQLGAPARQIPASASFAGDGVYAAGSDSITYVVSDTAPTDPDAGNGTVGGLTRLLGGILRKPSTVENQVVDVLDNVAPGVGAGTLLNQLLGAEDNDVITSLQPVDSLLESTLGGTLDSVTEVADAIDPTVGTVLDVAELVPTVGDLVHTLRIKYFTTYQRPDGTSRTNEVTALMLVPTPIDVDGDNLPDVTANLTLDVDPSAPSTIAGLPLVPTIDVIQLAGAPASLPMSIQAVIPAEGLVSLGNGDIRIGYDARTTDNPDRVTVRLGLAEGGFDLELTTKDAQDIALVGAIEGGLDLGIGGPVGPGDVDPGETRFAISLAPAPEVTKIAMGLGGGSAGIGASFTTSTPSDVSLSFAQDLGEDHITAIDADFETVDGSMGLVLDTGSASSGPVPELGLQLISDNPMDRIAMKMQTIDHGRVTDDLNLNLLDVPATVTFGVGDDGAIALDAGGEEIGLMEAGFASGGEIRTLPEPAHLYMLSDADLESASIRLPHISSLTAALSGDIGLDLVMAPTKLRAVMDSPATSLDAAIYDAPQQFSLGLASDGAFVISGSDPIDLITLTLRDSSGALAGAESVTVRIEDIPSLLAVSLLGGAVSFDTGGDPVGLLELVVGDAPPFVAGEDTLYASLDEAGMALAVRVHGLRAITASIDPSAPSFLLDTVANAIMNLTVSAPNADPTLPPLQVAGRIDRLKPNMVFGVGTDADGSITGLEYSADEKTNSIYFDVPGLAKFTVFDPLPQRFSLTPDLASGSVIMEGSEYFTLQLNAVMEGDLFGTGTPIEVTFDINTMRAKHFEFGLLSDLSPFEGMVDLTTLESPIALNINSRHADGTLNQMGNATRTLAAFNAGAATPTAQGALVIGIPGVALDPGLGSLLGTVPLTLTPRGLAADHAKVLMDMKAGQGGTVLGNALPGVFHQATIGTMHCTGTTGDSMGGLFGSTLSAGNGTSMGIHDTALIVAINIYMRNALCNIGTGGGNGQGPTPTALANLTQQSLSAPANVIAGNPVVQTFTVRNDGPNDAAAVVITASYDGALGDPTTACGANGTAGGGGGTVTCTYSTATTKVLNRAMTLTWPTLADTPPGTSVTTTFSASATTPGDDASGSATTTVQANLANLDITGTTGAAKAIGGAGDLVHTATVVNNGPNDATNLALAATSSDALAAPAVSCSDDGVVDGLACTWATVPTTGVRTITLTFGVPAGVADGRLDVAYSASSDTPGTGDAASASTEVGTVEANIGLTVDAAARAMPGEEVVHTATLTNDGPSTADGARILADYDDVLGAPAVTCSAGGTATDFPELQRARCLWLGDTAPGTERTMTLTWTADADTALGTVASIDYRATSNTPGSETSATGSTTIDVDLVAPSITGTTGPALWAPGTTLTQTATATTAGTLPTTGLKIVADLPGDSPAVPNPTVACTNSGTGAIVNDPDVADDTQAVCTWPGSTPTGTTRTMTLTWPTASLTAARTNASPADAVIGVDYSATANGVDASAPTNVTTTVAASVGNVSMSSGGAGASQLSTATLVHSGSAARQAPTTGNASVVITGTADPALAAVTPTNVCSTGGVAGTVSPGVYTCTWAPGTATTSRTQTLTWPANQPLGTYTTTFSSSSDVPGAWNTATRTTTLVDPNTINFPITTSSGASPILTNVAMAHSATATRQAPVGAAAVHTLTATLDPDLAGLTPAISCPSATPTTGAPGPNPGQVTCTWASSSSTSGRVMTVTYAAGTVPAGTHETTFQSGSNLPGAFSSVTRSTVVDQATAVMKVNGVTAPPTAAPGTTLVHHIDVRNVGTSPTATTKIVATHDGALGAPTVTCTGGVTNPATIGTPTHLSSTQDECSWGATAANSTIRRMTLTWNLPADQADTQVDVTYLATGTAAPGVQVLDAGASSSTSVVAPVPPAAPASTEPFWAPAVVGAPASSSTGTPAAMTPAPARRCLSLLGIKVCR